MRFINFVFYRFYQFSSRFRWAKNAALLAMILTSITIYLYLISFFALFSLFNTADFISVFVNNSADFSVLLIGLLVQLVLFQLFIYDKKYLEIAEEFENKEKSTLLRLNIVFWVYLIGSLLSLLIFILVLGLISSGS